MIFGNFFLFYPESKKDLLAESNNFLFKMEHLHFDVGDCRVGRVQLTEKEAQQAKSKWRSQKDWVGEKPLFKKKRKVKKYIGN